MRIHYKNKGKEFKLKLSNKSFIAFLGFATIVTTLIAEII